MNGWSPGYTQRELDEAQERYALRFPPDLVALYLERQPVQGYDWKTEDSRIRKMIKWPLEMLLAGVEDGFWWPDWGARPNKPDERTELARVSIDAAPRLIPILSHRFIPETPNEAGNPVFSMYGFDTIYYGANINEYFVNEFEGKHQVGVTKHISFWSDLVERHEEAYAFYADTEKPLAAIASIQAKLRQNGP